MDLRSYLNSLPPDAQRGFAAQCKTSLGHLRNVAGGYENKRASLELALYIERASKGAVRALELRPDLDWPSLRRVMSRIKTGDAICVPDGAQQ